MLISSMFLFSQAEDNMIRKFFSPTISPRYLSTTTLSNMEHGGNTNDEDGTIKVKSNENIDVSTGLIHTVYLNFNMHRFTTFCNYIPPIILMIYQLKVKF